MQAHSIAFERHRLPIVSVMSAENESAITSSSNTITPSPLGHCTPDDYGVSGKCNSIAPTNKQRHQLTTDHCAIPTITTICIDDDTSAFGDDNVVVVGATDTVVAFNERDQTDVTFTDSIATITTMAATMTTTTTALRRPNTSPTVLLTAPSIAVTSEAGESTLASATKRTCKRTGKVDFVRFDSLETVYNQIDHEEIVRRATIKDEIKK